MVMSSNALYFPYIDVPSTSWTTQAILYWDKLASIVPMDHLHRPEQMNELTRNLLSEGLVEPIVPGAFIRQIEKFDHYFIEFVERQRLQNRLHSSRHTAQRTTTRIHVEKMSRIPEFLIDAGLAKRLDWPWYEVDTVLANQFMAYLATVLSALPDINATPITDKAIVAASLGFRRSTMMRDSTLHTFKAREVVLRSLLPVPVGPIDINSLIKFKERHGNLLPSLRAKIETHCAYAALLTEPAARIAANDTFIKECNDQVAEIQAAMRPSFDRIALGSLVPLFGAGLALQTSDQGNTLAYMGNALSLAGVAYQAIASIRAPRVAQQAKPLAYIAHARRELISTKTATE